MNLTGFRDEVSGYLSLTQTDAAELARLDQAINDGVLHVLSETGAKVATATATLTAGEGDYELDTAILRVVWIQNSDGYQLEPVTADEIRSKRLNAASDVCRQYAVDGSNLLLVYPTPAAVSTLTLNYVPRPVTLATGTDTPSEIPAEYHYAVSLYAAARMGDYDDDQTSAQGTRYWQLFAQELARCRSRTNRKRGRTLGRVRVQPQSRVPHRNDVV